MRKEDAIKKLMHKVIRSTEVITQQNYESGIYYSRAKDLLEWLQKELGMSPPRLPEEDCQAIMSVYYAGYSFNQWEEDVEKDEKVQEAKRKRAEGRQRRLEKRGKS